MRANLLASLCLFWLSVAANAEPGLSQVQRKLSKEPVYRTKPKYCLLALGPEPGTRVWLVQDGDTLYVDRNGNGDLTAPADKVAAEKQDAADEGAYIFKAGDICDGERLHKELTVYVNKLDRLAEIDENVKTFAQRNPGGRGYQVFLEVEMPGWKGAGIGGRVQQRVFYLDANGVFQFADRAADAPIVHFGGPWQVSFFGPQKLTVGRDSDVVLGVGSPGIGPGSTAWIGYEGVIPTDKHPTLEVEYSPKHAGDRPVREHYELKRRC